MWYDKNDNLVKERVISNAAGDAEKYNEVEYVYDNRNCLVITKNFDGKKYNYTQNFYDKKGNLLRVYTGLSSPITINGLDDVTAGEDSEYAVTKYSYDALGRVTETVDALGQSEINTYDKATGLVMSSADRNGQTFVYSYDGLNNPKTKSLSDGTNAETKTYGMTGKITSAQNGTSTISYAYNDKGLLISETDAAAGTVKSFTYDSNGNRLTFTLARNGQIEMNQSYGYDKLNRLTSVSENGSVIAEYSYDNKNNRTRTVSGGETTNYTYNIANLLTSQTTGDKLNEQYTYYLNGNQKTKTSNGVLTAYEYDGMNRMSKENDTRYSFDDFGNRKSMTSGSSTTSYTYDLNNRLIKSVEKTGNETKTTAMFYDKNGNQVSKATMTNKPFGENVTGDYTISQNSDKNVAIYEYNCYNQITGIDTNGVISHYTYAPDGMRASKTTGGNTINFVYDNANVVEEITADGVNKYFRGLEIVKNGDNVYYIYNGQGDVSALADNAGNVVASYIFDAYGNQSEENTVYNPFGYRGEYTDSESGLVYLRARMYDPETGRFINEDPAKDGLNWYVYCSGNPIMHVDPSGEAGIDVAAALFFDAFLGGSANKDYGSYRDFYTTFYSSPILNKEINKNFKEFKKSGENRSRVTGSIGFYGNDLNPNDLDLHLGVGKADYTMEFEKETVTKRALWKTWTETQYSVTVTISDTYDFDEYREGVSLSNWLNNWGYDMQKKGNIVPFFWSYQFKKGL